MRAVVQRVKEARVEVDGQVVGKIGKGLVLLIGVAKDDAERDIEYLVEKVSGLRIFQGEESKLNLSVIDVRGDILVVSQFTLYGDSRKGRRLSFDQAAPPELAEKLYNLFVERLREIGMRVEVGRFRALMDVHLINWGPVTILLDSRKLF